MKYIVFIFIFFTTIGCKKDMYFGITFKVPEFKDSIIVESTILNDTIFTRAAWYMGSYKDYIILRANMDDYMLHLYDKTTGKRVKSFGELGRDPQQILELNEFNIIEDEGILTSYSQAENSILIFYLDSVINNKEHFMDKISLKNYVDMTFLEGYKCSQGFLLYGGKCEVYPKGARFSRFSRQGKILETYDEYPINSRPRSDSINKSTDWEHLYLVRTISPDGTKFAEGTRTGGLLETFKLSGKIESQILKGYYKPHFYQKNNDKIYTSRTQFCFYYLSASNNYLYALSFNGSNCEEYPVCEMQVFDWEGNPIKKYKTNKPLLNICVDESRGKVYALSQTPMKELLLISFNL